MDRVSWRRFAALLAFFALFSHACAFVQKFPFVGGGPKRGKVYVVKKGDTLWEISRKVKMSYQYLAEFNNIENPALIRVGQKIDVPKRGERPERAPPREKAPQGGTAPQEAPAAAAPPLHFDRGRFVWPVDGVLTSPFGMRHGSRHDGIDIGAKTGTPIVAADDGTVVYSGRLSGYGKLAIVRHKDAYFTAYAHCDEIRVKKGDKVKRGKSVVGRVGSTGHATGPHLHFEVRRKELPRNPLFYLPKR